MAKVKIQGNASGTGVLTISAPNTNANSTLTLPSKDVSLGDATAKAWCNFGATGPARDSHNVSSITDNAVGDFTINFANNMANNVYVPLTGQEGGFDVHRYNSHVSQTTSTYRLQVGYHTTSSTLVKADLGSMFYLFFGA